MQQWVKNVCRLCGQIEDISYDIFDSDENTEEIIKKCLHLEICKEDFKPKQICKSCFIKLNDFTNFIDLCYATNLKFESIYYTDSWHQSNSRVLYESVNNHKPSVIVSNRQSLDNSLHFYHPTNNDEAIEILPNYTLNQSDGILDFSVNYSSIQPVTIQNCFNECDSFDKQKEYVQNEENGSSCLVNENDPSDLLESVENESNSIVSNNVGPFKDSKSALISVEDVRKSLEAENVLKNKPHTVFKTKQSFSCPHCEKIFVRRTNLNAHISVHTKVRPYKCLSCPKTFAVKCHLTQHKKMHLDIFRCQMCHKNFDVPSKLSRHMRTHTQNRPFICSISNCNKGFSDKNNLKQHILTHSAEKKFSCLICIKQFRTKKNLKAHLTSHVENNKFQCKFCQKEFKYKHNFRTHLIKHTNKEENNKTYIKL